MYSVFVIFILCIDVKTIVTVLEYILLQPVTNIVSLFGAPSVFLLFWFHSGNETSEVECSDGHPGVGFGKITLQAGNLPLHYTAESGEDADDEGGGRYVCVCVCMKHLRLNVLMVTRVLVTIITRLQ